MADINPYNFVPLSVPVERTPYHERSSLPKDRYSGWLGCELHCLGPLVTLDQSCRSPKGMGFPRTRDERQQRMILGTTLKGMIRSVYEAITNACMPMVPGNALNLYQPLGSHARCTQLQDLCCACNLFGLVVDGTNLQGKLRFTDAIWVSGSLADKGPYPLKELATPHPQCLRLYSSTRQIAGKIAGRKFYYHHDANPQFTTSNAKATVFLAEYAEAKSRFAFQIYFDGLDAKELADLCLTLELREGLAHKLGLGKALGLGSCQIKINEKCSRVQQAVSRYTHWKQPELENLAPFKTDGTPPRKFPLALVELLRLNKSEEGKIGYLPGKDNQKSIDFYGIYDGKSTEPNAQWHKKNEKALEVVITKKLAGVPPIEPPPMLKPGEIAAWLESSDNHELYFITKDGNKKSRSKKGFQGKPEQLDAGGWFILFGEKGSKPAGKN